MKKNKKNNILVFNNSHSEAQLIKFLSSSNENNVYTVGFVNPKVVKNVKHFKVDYREIEKIKKIILENKIKFLIPCANDLSMYSIAKINNNKNFDKMKVIDTIHNKYKFREFEKLNFRSNINFSITNNFNLIKKLRFPILIKPIVGSGGKGIIKINSDKNLREKNFYKYKDYIFEEYIAGTNHGIFSIVNDKKIAFIFFDTEQRFINKFTVSSTHSHCTIPTTVKKRFTQKIKKIINKLELKNGILHFQVKFKNNKIYIIEVTRRIPGDQYLSFVEFSTNYPVLENIKNIYLNKSLKVDQNMKFKHILRKIIMAPSNGKYINFEIDKKISNKVIEKYEVLKKGNIISDYLNQRIAILFFEFKNKKELFSITRKIDNLIKINII